MYDYIAKIFSRGDERSRREIRKALISIDRGIELRYRIRKINSEQGVDLVHYCNLGNPAIFASEKIPYCIRLSSISNILRGAKSKEGQLDYDSIPLLLTERIEKRILKRAKNIVVPSINVAKIMEKKLEKGIRVLESPFVMSRESWDMFLYDKILKGKKYILHYGRMSYLKGTHVVAELVKPLLSAYRDLYLVMAGATEEIWDEENEEWTSAFELVRKKAAPYEDRVIYLGPVVREILFPIIENAVASLLPYRSDNLSNACIESMAIGTIVIGTDGASFEQLIEDGKSGLLCRRDDAVSFLGAINKVMEMSQAEKEEISNNAKMQIERLNLENVYNNFLKYYNNIIFKKEH